MQAPQLDRLFARYPRYAGLYAQVQASDVMLAASARTALVKHGNKLAAAAENILGWMAQAYGEELVPCYVERIGHLNALQERFALAPSAATLCAPDTPVDRDAYDIALLLSFFLTHHRFEILSSLKSFLDFVRAPEGRIASVGMGTGYELYVAANTLQGWALEGYDSDPVCRAGARRLLDHYGVQGDITLGSTFALTDFDESCAGRFDAIVLCELLEHLDDPLAALVTTKRYLRPGGAMFVTMAINIAQEDHIYLYPDVAACRAQVLEAGLEILHERALPVLLHEDMPTEAPAGALFHGNYVAIVRRPA